MHERYAQRRTEVELELAGEDQGQQGHAVGVVGDAFRVRDAPDHPALPGEPLQVVDPAVKPSDLVEVHALSSCQRVRLPGGRVEGLEDGTQPSRADAPLQLLIVAGRPE